MTPTLYTLGYQQRDLDEYIELLVAAKIGVVVDVRETPWSHKPGFSKTAFARALARHGIEYFHAQFAGNPKRLRAKAPSHAVCLQWYAEHLADQCEIVESFDQIVTELGRSGRRVCITCFERHADDCHRGVLAHRWQQLGRRRVEHLAVDGCERLVSA